MGEYRRINITLWIGVLLLVIIGFVTPRHTSTEEESSIHGRRGIDYEQFIQQQHHHHHHHHKDHHHYHRDNKMNKKKHFLTHHHRNNRKRGRALPRREEMDERPHPVNEKADFVAAKNHNDAVFRSSSRKRREKEHLDAKKNVLDVTSPTPSPAAVATTAPTHVSSTGAAFHSTVTKVVSKRIIPTTTISHLSSEKESSSRSSITCSTPSDCTNITNSVCSKTNICDCEEPLPVFISSAQECMKSVPLNATCDYDDQCSFAEEYSTCDKVKKICSCISGYEMKSYPDVGVNCVTKSSKSSSTTVDPAMIGVLAGLALMFVIICVVLRLFSKARFRENRSIFNTPNPRLMNASLFKDSKLLSPARSDRRGSRASMRGPPSRAASITSVNKDGVGRSPNGSLSKGRRGSTLSTASATGSAAAAAPPSSAKTPSPTSEKKQPPEETAVAIEAVD